MSNGSIDYNTQKTNSAERQAKRTAKNSKLVQDRLKKSLQSLSIIL